MTFSSIPFSPAVPSRPGVAITPPTMIADSIKREVDRVLNQLPETKAFVRIDVEVARGTNVVFGYRDTFDGKWKVAAGGWIGKDWSMPAKGWNAGASITIGMLR
jgi:hypothetical protein